MANLFAGSEIMARLSRMGAKYLPTIKDIKASQRFQQKQSLRPTTKKSASALPIKKSKQK